ncbi:MAG: pyridoxamine kinase [Desulfovibrionaceae bacterium]|nr:pyridoxamine kinase [Desulfovibrionaceae bacterium]
MTSADITKNTPPTVLAIHDLSGFGRGSLTTVLTIMGTMGVQACPIPTSLLSAHIEFEGFSFLDLTGEMEKIITHWQKLGLKFDAVYTGFLGSPAQAALVRRAIGLFSHPGTIRVIDPVLGDNGSLYPTMDSSMVEEMRLLIKDADIITPNLTEAALLLGEPYRELIDSKSIAAWLERLADMGPQAVVITSAIISDESEPAASSVIAYNRLPHGRSEFWQVKCDYIPAHYPGTGDIFASVLTGSLLWREELPVAIARAMRFIATGIEQSELAGAPRKHGILLEQVLPSLNGPLSRTRSQQLFPYNSKE